MQGNQDFPDNPEEYQTGQNNGQDPNESKMKEETQRLEVVTDQEQSSDESKQIKYGENKMQEEMQRLEGKEPFVGGSEQIKSDEETREKQLFGDEQPGQPSCESKNMKMIK